MILVDSGYPRSDVQQDVEIGAVDLEINGSKKYTPVADLRDALELIFLARLFDLLNEIN